MNPDAAFGEAVEILKQMSANMDRYDRSLKRIFSRKLTKQWHCRRYFLEILDVLSQIYANSTSLKILEPKLFKIVNTSIKNSESPMGDRDQVYAKEQAMRTMLEQRLKTLPCLASFKPHNAFADYNQLRTRTDCIENIGVHLPEIYGETLGLRHYISESMASPAHLRDGLEAFFVGMDHMVKHHVSYCLHALEILSHEIHWSFPWEDA